MKILGNISEVLTLPDTLSIFITSSSPWANSHWDPEQIGWIFVLDDDDLAAARSLNITPHIRDDPLIIDLEEYDLFEGDPIYDPATGYLNIVGIVGQDGFGFSLFLPDKLMNRLPNLRRNLNHGLLGNL